MGSELPSKDFGRELEARTRRFAVTIIRLSGRLPKTTEAMVVRNQLTKAGTSVGANYRAACRGRSSADVMARLGVVEEEADETMYWLELLVESGTATEARVKDMMTEANEIVAMTVSSIKTMKAKSG